MARKMIEIEQIVGASEIAEKLGLTSAMTINQWTKRHADFPRPFKVLRAGGLWDWREIEKWAVRTGRLSRLLNDR